MFVIVDKITGIPYGGFCTCTVGFSERCGHVGGTLFRLADLVANGVKEVQDEELSVTSQLCMWTDPKGEASTPAVMDEFNVTKTLKM